MDKELVSKLEDASWEFRSAVYDFTSEQGYLIEALEKHTEAMKELTEALNNS